MKFLRLGYYACIAALAACMLDTILIWYYPYNAFLSSFSEKWAANLCSYVMISYTLVISFLFPYILKLFKEKQVLYVLSYFFVIGVVFYLVRSKPIQLVFDVVDDLLLLYVWFSIKAKPIRKLMRVSGTVQGIMALLSIVAELGSLQYLGSALNSLWFLVNCIFNFLLIRISINWLQDQKALQHSLQEIQSIA
jgi:hypothetical protein